MFIDKATDFIFGRDHRLVRDYLILSGALMIGATSLGMYLSSSIEVSSDPLPVASINKRSEADARIYHVVRSVFNPQDTTVQASTSRNEGETTGSLGDDLRKVTIDPCTGKTKN
jgi:hypothetical protein